MKIMRVVELNLIAEKEKLEYQLEELINNKEKLAELAGGIKEIRAEWNIIGDIPQKFQQKIGATSFILRAFQPATMKLTAKFKNANNTIWKQPASLVAMLHLQKRDELQTKLQPPRSRLTLRRHS